MKPDEQQKRWLQSYLGAVLKYRETYEEVYDHVLLALENRQQEKFFEGTVNAIINEDFGGVNGLFTMEKNCENAVVKQYWRLFSSYLKLPYLIYIAFISVILAYIAVHVNGKITVLSCTIWIIFSATMPVLLFATRKFKIGHKSAAPKRLSKDSILGALAYKPFKFLLWWYFLCALQKDIPGIIVLDVWKYIGPVIRMIIFIAMTIHLFSYIRLTQLFIKPKTV